MKNWLERKAQTLAGKHARLVNLTQAEFAEFCKGHGRGNKLELLTIAGNVRGYKITDFSLLKSIPNLKELYLEDAITQDGFEQVCSLGDLSELLLHHAGKLTSLEPIRNLIQLRGLTITTPTGWISKLLTLPSLEPIHNLAHLEYLNLAGVAFLKDGLRPIMSFRKLKELHVIKRYWPEGTELKKLNPSLKWDKYYEQH